ncbi:sugar transferase [Clostridium culturomicium]|uniref:sugar transferase n=1 Tax=Clostridium culturomicium TaxID=1499683 RepID=UPI00058D6A02|nr:sugar transferase [Clostridium culturomicium]
MVLKRIFDMLLSTVGLVLLFPFLMVMAVLVKVKLGSPVFFIQERVGKDNKLFKMIKFRSMLDDYDETGKLLSDNERLTDFGRILRATSIDELPELINVLKGDMSIVGPRPLLKQYLPLYSRKQLRRHEVRPGITGWAQINGRNAISWREKFKHDVWYIDNWSLWLDIKIIFMTVRKVFVREGVNQDDKVTMEYFNGKN